MWVFTIFCLFFVLLKQNSVLIGLESELVFLQHLCWRLAPVEKDLQPLWQALVCGKNLYTSPFWSHALKASGLIHIFVVSGSHFLVLISLFNLLKFPQWLQCLLLWAFNAVTGFSPPGTRACLSLHTKFLFKMRPDQNLLAVGFLCLALENQWITSYSFWLSWLAAFVLLISPKDSLRIFQNFLFFSVWVLLGFQISFWSLPLNILIAPIIGWVLFPLALGSFIPVVSYIFERSLAALEWLLKTLDITAAPMKFQISLSALSFIVLGLHLVLQIYYLEIQGRKIR